jgi:hypothetical protein
MDYSDKRMYILNQGEWLPSAEQYIGNILSQNRRRDLFLQKLVDYRELSRFLPHKIVSRIGYCSDHISSLNFISLSLHHDIKFLEFQDRLLL